jgi:hypothetical protein
MKTPSFVTNYFWIDFYTPDVFCAVCMTGIQEEIFFEEDLSFFLKKRLKKIGLGLVLLIIPPILFYYMFFYLLYWSSLFQTETGLMLFALLIAPIVGFYYLIKAMRIPRIKIYYDRIPNPAILGKRYIPLKDIDHVTKKITDEEPVIVELYLKKGSSSTRDMHLVLGEFLDKDSTKITAAFHKLGVEVKLG